MTYPPLTNFQVSSHMSMIPRFTFRSHPRTLTPAWLKSPKIFVLSPPGALLISYSLILGKPNLILFGMRQLLSKILDVRVPFLSQNLAPVPLVKDLGIILDSNLTFNEHVKTLTSSLISSMCQISKVRHLFQISILNCLVFSKLFYCSTVCMVWHF